MTAIIFSRGRDQFDAHPTQRVLQSFDVFEADVLQDRSKQKGQVYIAAPFRVNGAGRPHRCKEGTLPRVWLPFDLDGMRDGAAFGDLCLWLQRFRGFAYTTASHQPEAPRARLVLQASRPVDRAEGQRICLALERDMQAYLGDDVATFDQSVYRGEQPCFTPLLDAQTFRFDGAPVDADTILLTAPKIDEAPGTAERAQTAATNDPILRHLADNGMVKREFEAGHYAVVCPCADSHSSESHETSTVYMLPNFGGVKYGKFHCLHDHCRDRKQEAFVVALGLDPKRVWKAQATAGGPEVAESQPATPNATADDLAGRQWPDALEPDALHGIAGEIVRMIEPHTEADPAAILLQTLVAFGALVGRGPHVRVEGDQHHPNLFVLLVGGTSKGRKGTSWSRVRQIFERVPSWKPTVSGLSSGEGLKFNVRDPVQKTAKKKSGEIVTEIVDEGVFDKRLLVIESEFAQALRATQRQGNTLSATVREAWDTGRLATLTKNDPITATGAHVAIIGHITADELRAELTATDTANGFANRFLFVAVKRSKNLPFGGDQAVDDELSEIARRLSELAVIAQTRHVVGMTPATRAAWAKVYGALSAARPGLSGSITARAEAQCLRLSLVYALLDGADRIDVPHLLAALAVWERCEETARYVFGDSLGDRVADEILRSVRVAGADGRTRTEISALFKRHQNAERIEQALARLKERGLAKVTHRLTAGRPEEIWTV